MRRRLLTPPATLNLECGLEYALFPPPIYVTKNPPPLSEVVELIVVIGRLDPTEEWILRLN